MFQVGQKVVCVDDFFPSPLWSNGDTGGLKAGRVYTIRWIGVSYHPYKGRAQCILLEGITRIYYGTDWPFKATRFRPAVERKTDISIFRSLLTPHKEFERT